MLGRFWNTLSEYTGFFKDRIQRYGILSLFILLFGSFMGTWMKDKTFIFWSFLLGIIGFIRTYLIFCTADKKDL